MNKIKLKAPYLTLLGEDEDPTYAKTGLGLVQWRPKLVAGQLRFSEFAVDLGVPDMTIEEAVDQDYHGVSESSTLKNLLKKPVCLV